MTKIKTSVNIRKEANLPVVKLEHTVGLIRFSCCCLTCKFFPVTLKGIDLFFLYIVSFVHTHRHIYTFKIDLYISGYALCIKGGYYLSVDFLGKKPLLLDASGSFGLLVAVLVGIGGGIFGNTACEEDNHSGSESNTEWEG